IYTGCEIFHSLRQHKQGTVCVDLLNRRATFEPVVSPNVAGATVGFGMASLDDNEAEDMLSSDEMRRATTAGRVAETAAAKKALLQTLCLPPEACDQLEV